MKCNAMQMLAPEECSAALQSYAAPASPTDPASPPAAADALTLFLLPFGRPLGRFPVEESIDVSPTAATAAVRFKPPGEEAADDGSGTFGPLMRRSFRYLVRFSLSVMFLIDCIIWKIGRAHV